MHHIFFQFQAASSPSLSKILIALLIWLHLGKMGVLKKEPSNVTTLPLRLNYSHQLLSTGCRLTRRLVVVWPEDFTSLHGSLFIADYYIAQVLVL